MDGTDKGNGSTGTARSWTGQGSNPGLCGERPVTDRLSHDRPQKHPLTTSVICRYAVRAVIILKLTLHTYALKSRLNQTMEGTLEFTCTVTSRSLNTL